MRIPWYSPFIDWSLSLFRPKWHPPLIWSRESWFLYAVRTDTSEEAERSVRASVKRRVNNLQDTMKKTLQDDLVPRLECLEKKQLDMDSKIDMVLNLVKEIRETRSTEGHASTSE